MAGTQAWEVPGSGPAGDLAAGLAAQLPVLRTERLEMRVPRLEDFAIYAEILMSDRALHMDGPFDREGAWNDFAQYVSCWLLRGHGAWAMCPLDSATPVGFVAIGFEHGDHEPELGWFVTEAAEGRGLAFEAASAALAHGRDVLNLPGLVSYIDHGNSRSLALAQRLGARRDAAAEAKFAEPVLVYRHLPLAGNGRAA